MVDQYLALLNLVEIMGKIRDLEMHQILILLLHRAVDMVVVMETLLVVLVVLVVEDTMTTLVDLPLNQVQTLVNLG